MRPGLVPELAVSDIAVSLSFYQDLLRFVVRHARPEEGFAYLELGTAELMLDQLGAGRDWVTAPLEYPLGRGLNLQIELAALDPVLERLAGAGVALFQQVETRSCVVAGGTITQRQFCVQDPDGYLLRFSERLP